MSDPVDTLVDLVRTLPDRPLEQLVVAAREGAAAIATLRARTGSSSLRAACSALQPALAVRSHLELAGLLDGLLRAAVSTARRSTWCGPARRPA